MKIKITKCEGFGPAFENLTPESIHERIDTPKSRKNKEEIWIMGNGEPIRLLSREFTII